MRLQDLQEARYTSPKRIRTATLGLYEDGPEPIDINNDGLTGYFAHCLADYGREGVDMSSVREAEEAFEDEDVIKRPEEYDEQYAEEIKQSMDEFLRIARAAPAVYSHGFEYSVGFTATNNNDPDVIIHALREYIIQHPEEFEIRHEGDITKCLNNAREALVNEYD